MVLTPSSLAYYHHPTDMSPRRKLPLTAVCRASRKHAIDLVITISIRGEDSGDRGGADCGGEGQGEWNLLTENEKELRGWLLMLNAMATVDGNGSSTFAKERQRADQPVRYVNRALRRAWLNQMNKARETPLLVLARFKNRSRDGALLVPTARIVQLALWLLENGCDIDAQNSSGQSALHVAVRYGNIDLAACLIAKNANMHLKNFAGYTVMEMCPPDIRTVLANSASAHGYSDAIHSTPGVIRSCLRRCSYVTLNFHKHSQISTKHRYSMDILIIICLRPIQYI